MECISGSTSHMPSQVICSLQFTCGHDIPYIMSYMSYLSFMGIFNVMIGPSPVVFMLTKPGKTIIIQMFSYTSLPLPAFILVIVSPTIDICSIDVKPDIDITFFKTHPWLFLQRIEFQGQSVETGKKPDCLFLSFREKWCHMTQEERDNSSKIDENITFGQLG